MLSGRSKVAGDWSGPEDEPLVVGDAPDLDELKRHFAVECGIPEGLRLIVRTGRGVVREERSPGPCMLIGSGEGCDVRLDDPQASERHAVVLCLAGRTFVCDLASAAGTRLNGRPITKVWTESAPTLEIGETTVTVVDTPAWSLRIDEDEPSEPVRQHVRIELLPGSNRPPYRVRSDVILFGKDRRCKLQCREESVADVHGMLVCTPRTAWVVDLGTPEGTVVDGRPVRLAPLHDGSVVMIGRNEIPLRITGGLDAATGHSAPLSQDLALEMLERFEAAQRQMVDELSHWVQEFSQAILQVQQKQFREWQAGQQMLKGELVEMMRALAASDSEPVEFHENSEEVPDGTDGAGEHQDPEHGERVAVAAENAGDERGDEESQGSRSWLSSLLRRAPR